MNKRQEKYVDKIMEEYKLPGNLYSRGMTDKEFRDLMCSYFLGEGYYITDPISDSQCTTIIALEIIAKNPK